MKIIDGKLTSEEIEKLRKRYGDYVKLTVDVEEGLIVAGCQLHADGEKLLLERGSKQKDVWGGGINIVGKEIDTTAVLNIRPNQGNDNLEILDAGIRSQFQRIVKSYFRKLWH